MTGTTKEQVNSEKIRNLIHTVSDDTVFKSFKELYNYFGLKPKNENTINIGSHSRKAILDELSRHCTWEKMEKSNKYIITKVFDFPLPKIDKKFLSSKFYPMCGYLLLVFLAEKQQQCYENDEVYRLTTNKIMKIVYLCSDDYSKTKLNLAKQDNESIFFISEVRRYLSKVSRGMLVSLKSNKFFSFIKCYMLIDKHGKHREATDEETKIIDKYYEVILKEYNMNNKQAIQFSRHKKEIDSKFEEHLGYKHYNSNKFNLSADLASNAEHLRSVANLSDNCGSVVNSLVCSDIYNLVFEKIISIREDEVKQHEDKTLAQQLFIDEFKPELVDEYIAKVIEEFSRTWVGIFKFVKKWSFDSDDAVVRYRIESLIKTFIKIDDQECEHEKLS